MWFSLLKKLDYPTRIGTFTNFVNLLDLCAVATPVQPGRSDGHVTVIADRFDDQIAIDVAAAVTAAQNLDFGPGEGVLPRVFDGLPVVVFGAHMRGMALNSQLTALGARFERIVHTAERYRMGYLPAADGGVPKPAVTYTSGAGTSLEGELWHLPPGRLADFAELIPLPLALGQILLDDDSSVLGFCAQGVMGPDISAYRSWRAFLAGEKN